MTPQAERELFDLLGEIRRRYPEWRFGQLIANLAAWTDRAVWEVEDADLADAARSHLAAAAEREHQPTSGGNRP